VNTFNVIREGGLGHVFVVHRTTTVVLWELCVRESDSEAVYLVCLVYLVYLVYFVL